MKEYKNVLITIASRNKLEDLKSNRRYWQEVIDDIRNCSNENDLLKIAQSDFGFESLKEIKT